MTPGRLAWLDAARGLAVVSMVVFHLIWDLGNFGYVDADLPFSPGVKLFGHAIAESFLFVAGVALVLAHARNASWRPFWRRIGVVAGAAGLVSLGTYLVFPQAFVFFGILHCIALASLLAAPLLGAPWPAAALAALLAAAAPSLFASQSLDAPWFWWTGLSSFEPPTNDYRPIFPWSAGLFAGVAAARFCGAFGLRAPFADRGAAPLNWLGRHSLAIYLLHQPLLFGLFTGLAALGSAPRAAEGDAFLAACELQCAVSGGAAEVCQPACACTAARAAQEAIPADAAARAAWIGEISRDCLAKAR